MLTDKQVETQVALMRACVEAEKAFENPEGKELTGAAANVLGIAFMLARLAGVGPETFLEGAIMIAASCPEQRAEVIFKAELAAMKEAS